jgi:hypothetical protein
MGRVNVCWGVLLDIDATHTLPHVALLALNKVTKIRCASLFPTQLTLEGALNLLDLSNPSGLPQGPWAIHAHHPNTDQIDGIDLMEQR